MTRPVPRRAVQRLAPYVPGRPIEEVQREHGLTDVVKLASNENPLGPSPRALEAAARAARDVHRYPDGAARALRGALGERFGFPPASVVLGAGAAELIDLTLRTFCEPGDEMVVPAGIFRMFVVAAGRAGATAVEVPCRTGWRPDLDAMRARVSTSTRIVAIANPNNPTGSYVPEAEMRAFARSLPENVLLVVDEAYFEFARGVVSDYGDGLDLLREGRTVLVLRTFSKIAGLAGLRLGYGFGPADVVAAIDKVREPFNTTSVGQAAALAALDDDEHRERTRRLTLEERARLHREVSARGLVVHPSIGNFLLVDVPVPFAPLEPEFARRGVIVRPMGGWGFPASFRLSVGTAAENGRFLTVLDEVLAAGLIPAPAARA